MTVDYNKENLACLFTKSDWEVWEKICKRYDRFGNRKRERKQKVINVCCSLCQTTGVFPVSLVKKSPDLICNTCHRIFSHNMAILSL